ncbi:thymidine phosphorylase [Sulfitobacter aestuarii]|uniref:Thymidine phosphorylase n=1 Tax=Sulfitobacter aestuarii TaxID=2161676 RepID=A0ABW5U7D8_9RHOB
MQARTILGRLRHGEALDPAELAFVAQGLADDTFSDAQAGAFAMGICRNGLDEAGRVALTLAMRDSGRVLDWGLDGPVLDKHSTGGVGDCVSLLLAPALAACGAYVPMISGRGLGHTGGTLDKLEAIPGLSTQLNETAFRDLVADTGCAIVSASAEIAPADRRLYALRDVTATVDSIDLITASILSKKLAAGLDALVLDVKVGSGAFMKDIAAGRALAQALCVTANQAGCRCTALISDMNAPLVPALGNALEVHEVMQVLCGGTGGALAEITAELGGVLLAHGGLAADAGQGAAAIRGAIRSGAAAERFARMIAAMGGPDDFLESWSELLPQAPVRREVRAGAAGHVGAIDGEALGLAVVALGGGRAQKSDVIDPAVGLSQVIGLGARVERDAVLAQVHARNDAEAAQAVAAVQAAFTLSETPPAGQELILERIG